MNRWNIPDFLERDVIERDAHCVYCGIEFVLSNESRKSKPTWEHIVNDARIISLENIARCCTSCNASKGAKLLTDWLNSSYCKKKNITKNNVALVVKVALDYPPTLDESNA
ncbi:hypothetical protein ABXJ76_03630 [Methylobacter sp. G7]|uniref:hypothetical protein n=1 Tax=Methylobacter sp. G7 TaxID=3230117 RepID=UPI003D80861C